MSNECVHHDYTMVENYIRELQWSPAATDTEKALVAGNIRGFYEHLRGLEAASTPLGFVDPSMLDYMKRHPANCGPYSEKYGQTMPVYASPEVSTVATLTTTAKVATPAIAAHGGSTLSCTMNHPKDWPCAICGTSAHGGSGEGSEIDWPFTYIMPHSGREYVPKDHAERKILDLEIEKLAWRMTAKAVDVYATGSADSLDKAVNRFLAWPLPKGFAPDCGISFDGRKDDEWNKGKSWPIGTNLFTADQAKAMFLHCVSLPPTGASDAEVELTELIDPVRYEVRGLMPVTRSPFTIWTECSREDYDKHVSTPNPCWEVRALMVKNGAAPEISLPSLPEPALTEQAEYLSNKYISYFTIDQMHAYAKAALTRSPARVHRRSVNNKSAPGRR